MQRISIIKINFPFISQNKILSCSSHSKCNLVDGMSVHVKRKITLEDVETFCKVTGDYNPIHKNIVHGALLNGLVSGVMGTKLPGPGTVVISQKFQFPNPCYVGSCVNITVSLVSVRKIITCKYSCALNDQKIVLDGEAKLILTKVPVDM